MSFQRVISRRYAKGLMLASPVGDWDQVVSELSDLVDVYTGEDRLFSRIFEDPAFSPLDRKKVINKIVEKYQLNSVLRHFLLLLIQKDRMSLLSSIYDAAVSYIDEKRGRIRATVKSLTPIDEQMLNGITEALRAISQKQVVITTEIDPELLGGIRVEMNGTIFDGSVKAKLDEIRQELTAQVGTNKAL